MSDTKPLELPAADPTLWLHDPQVTFLNHGAFGSCPRAVLAHQHEWQLRLERQPLQFLVRELEGHLDAARAALAQFVGAAPDDLVFVPNTTAGVNTVLRSLRFAPGDELLVTNQEYNASRNALNYVAERTGAQVVVAHVPFPVARVEELVESVLAAVSPRTRLVLLDHVTSTTGLVMPLERLLAALNARGIETLVDGAHAPGMIPLNLSALGATYYTGNCHKWLCAPKGAALLHVRRDRQAHIRPLVISHGANSRRTDRSRFQLEFGWTGTGDPSAWLSVPETLRYVGSLLPGGWPAVMARNRALTLAARRLLCDALAVTPPCPEGCLGSLAAVPLPDAPAGQGPRAPWFEYPLQDALRECHGIEVPVFSWPAPPHRLLRIAPQLYTSLPQYRRLAAALQDALADGF